MTGKPAMPVIAIGLLPFFGDPAAGVFRSRDDARNMNCEHLSVEEAIRENPGQLRPSRPRGDFYERRVVQCRQRVIPQGFRPSRSEAILEDLASWSTETAAYVVDQRPDFSDATWLVEAYYPDAAVEHKLSFAVKNALMEQGVVVSDRSPALAVGDIDVITRLSPLDAYPIACKRYAQTGSLGADDVLLAIVSVDPRETSLHAGLCTGDGRWMWLQ